VFRRLSGGLEYRSFGLRAVVTPEDQRGRPQDDVDGGGVEGVMATDDTPPFSLFLCGSA